MGSLTSMGIWTAETGAYGLLKKNKNKRGHRVGGCWECEGRSGRNYREELRVNMVEKQCVRFSNNY